MTTDKIIPSVSVTYTQTGTSTRSNELGMRPMQERAWARRGEPYLLIKSPPASGKSRALMFIALDKVHHQGLRQAIIARRAKNGSSLALKKSSGSLRRMVVFRPLAMPLRRP